MGEGESRGSEASYPGGSARPSRIRRNNEFDRETVARQLLGDSDKAFRQVGDTPNIGPGRQYDGGAAGQRLRGPKRASTRSRSASMIETLPSSMRRGAGNASIKPWKPSPTPRRYSEATVLEASPVAHCAIRPTRRSGERRSRTCPVRRASPGIGGSKWSTMEPRRKRFPPSRGGDQGLPGRATPRSNQTQLAPRSEPGKSPTGTENP